MKTYEYWAKSPYGEDVNGTDTAENILVLRNRLNKQGLVVLNITPIEKKESGMNIIGIDPGFKGAICLLRGHDGIPELWDIPVEKVSGKNQIDEVTLMLILKSIKHETRTHAYVEKVGSMPKQGIASAFNFGTGWGIIRGMLVGLGIPYTLVTPQRWKKVMTEGNPDAEYHIASRMWPEVCWKRSERCKKPHDGYVDAALIAEYGRRVTK